MADLKRVYAAVDEQTALSELDSFDEKWSSKYPKIAVSWRANWANLSTYFKYPAAVRTLIYTMIDITKKWTGKRKDWGGKSTHSLKYSLPTDYRSSIK